MCLRNAFSALRSPIFKKVKRIQRPFLTTNNCKQRKASKNNILQEGCAYDTVNRNVIKSQLPFVAVQKTGKLERQLIII